MADNTTVQRGGASSNGRSKTYAEIRAERDAKKGTVTTTTTTVKKKDGWIRSLIVAGLIAFVIRTFFFEAFRIPTGSMKNTLLVGDYLFVNKIGYFIESPKYIPFTEIEIPHVHLKTWGVHRGDVVVFEYPGDRDVVVPREKKVNYIKRCIGEPGDVIEIKNKQVYVNGKVFLNPQESILQRDTAPVGFVDPHIFPKGAQWNKDNFGPLRIPKKGDVIPLNKESLDRWYVFIAREGHKVELGMNDQVMIDDKLATQYTVQRDYLWMMGDNRDDSEDSRFWGFAPMDNVVGSGFIIYWSWYNPPSSGMGDGYDPDEVQQFKIRWGRIGRLIH
jgi:signal peptidase I